MNIVKRFLSKGNANTLLYFQSYRLLIQGRYLIYPLRNDRKEDLGIKPNEQYTKEKNLQPSYTTTWICKLNMLSAR